MPPLVVAVPPSVFPFYLFEKIRKKSVLGIGNQRNEAYTALQTSKRSFFIEQNGEENDECL